MQKILLLTLLFISILVIWFTCTNCRSIRRSTDARPITHEIWDGLLKKHVQPDGFVNYKGFLQDSIELNRYLAVLESAHPNDKNWSRKEQMAYWINAYNAYTIQLVLRYYPVKSIKDIKPGIPFINSVWDIKFINIEGYTYDLNNIEHNILRPIFEDARVHAAINCASYSCPRLATEAYTPERLEEQLETAMRGFLSDPLRNRISTEKAELSKIFSWFKGDFTHDAGTIRDYLNRYSDVTVTKDTKIQHLEYDWRLNEAN